MFFANNILNKKGPLGGVWLAAHVEDYKKLTKQQIHQTKVVDSVESIKHPVMPLALRLSGHLLLGVCRIHSRQVQYLVLDCNEAFTKIKTSFKPGDAVIDLAPQQQHGRRSDVTIDIEDPDSTVDPRFLTDLDDIFGLPHITTPQKREVSAPETITSAERITLNDTSMLYHKSADKNEILKEGLDDWDDDVEIPRDAPSGVTPDIIQLLPDRSSPQPVEPEQPEPFDNDAPLDPQLDLGPMADVFEEPAPMSPLQPMTPQPFEPEPIEPSNITAPVAPAARNPRKRQAIKDDALELTNAAIKEQLDNTKDTLRKIVQLPVTEHGLKRRAIEAMGVERLLQLPLCFGAVNGRCSALMEQALAYSRKNKRKLCGEPPKPEADVLPEPEPEADVPPFFDEVTFEPDLPRGEDEMDPEDPRVTGSMEFVTIQQGDAPTDETDGDTRGKNWSNRTRTLIKLLDQTFENNANDGHPHGNDKNSFFEMCKNNKRQTVSRCFFELLVLKKDGMIELEQTTPYSEILISKSEHFNENRPINIS